MPTSPKIERALLTVSDKTDLVPFARSLVSFGVQIISTGGTAKATVALLKGQGAEVVGVSFLIELVELGGRARLAGERVSAVLQY